MTPGDTTSFPAPNVPDEGVPDVGTITIVFETENPGDTVTVTDVEVIACNTPCTCFISSSISFSNIGYFLFFVNFVARCPDRYYNAVMQYECDPIANVMICCKYKFTRYKMLMMYATYLDKVFIFVTCSDRKTMLTIVKELSNCNFEMNGDCIHMSSVLILGVALYNQLCFVK